MIRFTSRMICLATFALGIASAAYDVTLYDNVTANGTQLKAGNYQVEMQGDKAVFKIGDKTISIPATLSKSDSTYSSTVFVSQRSKLIEIDLGGTSDKIIFAASTK
jgi:hypothetical protein